MSAKITIDGREVEVADGHTVLEGARQLGIDIPTLCFLEKCGPMTSCLVCIVKMKFNGRTSVVPSCGMKAVNGMVIESETDEVREMRKTALELLLSDHVGDCFAPCHRICPLRLDIPEMLRLVKDSKLPDAMKLVRDTMPLASVTGRLCNKPCEQGCRRGTWDDSMAIRDIECIAADTAFVKDYVPPCAAPSGKRVAIVGAGPAGLGAAWELTRDGHACTVIDRGDLAGGSMRKKPSEAALPRRIVDAEVDLLVKMGVTFEAQKELGRGVTVAELASKFDVVLIAIGESAKTQAAALGLTAMATGLKVSTTGQTSIANVFAAGAAVRPAAQVTRAIAEGTAAAKAIDQFLRGEPIRRAEKVFSSIMGKVEREEVELFVRSTAAQPATSNPCGSCGMVRDVDASAEASRCLHCDCRAEGNCSLQHYSEMLGADPGRFKQHRRRFEQHEHPGNVLYEPGKCILCGICVEIAKQSAEPLGLTFIGRGFDVRVGAPMNREFDAGLQKVAAECVEGCPTGAISFRSGKTVSPLPTHQH
jgi:ferredoxin